MIELAISTDPAQVERLDKAIEETLSQRSKRSNFDTLSDLIMRLGKEGYSLRFNVTLLIKSRHDWGHS